MTSIENILNGVESRSTGYQDGNRYWNRELDLEKEYEEPLLARVVENGDRHVLIMDQKPAKDHIAYRSIMPGNDNLVEEELELDMHEATEEELYREIRMVLSPENYRVDAEASSKVPVASD